MIEFTLPTMTCAHCERSVTETVRRIDPQARLEIDLPAHRLRIGSDQPRERFAEALSEEGYAPA